MNSASLAWMVNDNVRLCVQDSVRNYSAYFIDDSVGYKAFNSVASSVNSDLRRSIVDFVLGPVWDSIWKIVLKSK